MRSANSANLIRDAARPAVVVPMRRLLRQCGVGARGFTLIEIMVVVVILAILAALIVPRVMSRPDEARVIAAQQDIRTIVQALKLYRLDNLRYPTTEQGLAALVKPPSVPPLAPNWKAGGYLERLPRDPWGNPYQYLSPGLRGEIDVFSFGADGVAGGDGFDADVGSWSL
jgi:general secretion pathway protein G